MMDAIIQPTTHNPAPTALKSNFSYRIDVFDNGPKPKRPKTQYGIVLDVNNSKQRFHFNFGVIDDANLFKQGYSPKTSANGYKTLHEMAKRWSGDDLWKNPNAHLVTAKQNNLSGSYRYDLLYGAQGFHHELGSIMIWDGIRAPKVYLYADGTEIEVDLNLWEPLVNSRNPVYKWRCYL